MGLDGIELIMAVEEEFKIVIADVEAASCTTVGKLVELVFSRLKQNEGVPCPSQHGFYVVRRKVREFLDLGRFRVRPETRLDELIGRTDRRQVWCGLIQNVVERGGVSENPGHYGGTSGGGKIAGDVGCRVCERSWCRIIGTTCIGGPDLPDRSDRSDRSDEPDLWPPPARRHFRTMSAPRAASLVSMAS